MKDAQYAQLVDMDCPYAVFEEVKSIFIQHYRVSDFWDVRKAFNAFNDLYEGKYSGYGKCNTKYHDKIHTTDALLAMARLIDGYNIKNNAKKLPVGLTKAALISTLFHDAGYIQRKSDHNGTGAKYTLQHEERSVEFLKHYLSDHGFSRKDISFASKIVICTGLNMNIARIDFSRKYEKLFGLMLGTSDLIGQMASRTYLERLLHLYKEFKEGHVHGYESEFDLLKKTKKFYEVMMARIRGELEGVNNYALYHFKKRYGINEDLYKKAIDNHMIHLEGIIKSGPSKYREALRRKVRTKCCRD